MELAAGEQKLVFTYNGTDTYLMNIDWYQLEGDKTAVPTAVRLANTLSVRPVSLARGSVGLMVHASEDFEVRLYGMNGNLVGIQSGTGNAFVEFGESEKLPQGNYIAVVKSGSLQKTLRVRAF